MVAIVDAKIFDFIAHVEHRSVMLEDYLSILADGAAIKGNVPLLNKLVCSGKLNFSNDVYTKIWKL